MKSAIIATLLAGVLALPVASTASAAAPSLGTITVQGGTTLTPGQTATVLVQCPVVSENSAGIPIFSPIASIWLATPQGMQLVWQVSSHQPGSCVEISGTNIPATEMPTEATISVPSYAPPGKTRLVALNYHGDEVASASVTVAGTVTKPDPTPNPYLMPPTGKGAKTSVTTPSTPKTSTSFQSVVRIVAPRAKTPWWTRLLKRVLGIF